MVKGMSIVRAKITPSAKKRVENKTSFTITIFSSAKRAGIMYFVILKRKKGMTIRKAEALDICSWTRKPDNGLLATKYTPLGKKKSFIKTNKSLAIELKLGCIKENRNPAQDTSLNPNEKKKIERINQIYIGSNICLKKIFNSFKKEKCILIK